jgi:hypothetical protein
MTDEYGIKAILDNSGVDSDKVLHLITAQIDKVCGNYLMSAAEIRQSAFTEMKCYLLQAMIDTRNDGKLKDRIQKIVQEISDD